MKKLLYLLIPAGILIAGIAYATNVTVPSSPGSGYYLCGNSNGTYSATTTPCSGSSTSTISINGVSSTVFSLNSSTYLGITASGTAFTFTNLGVTSTAGNWAGTWQGVNSSTFYLASNPSSYISTSTGLTTANFATTSISQWNNDAHYVTSTSATINASDTQVVFMDGAILTGDSNFIWSSSTQELKIGLASSSGYLTIGDPLNQIGGSGIGGPKMFLEAGNASASPALFLSGFYNSLGFDGSGASITLGDGASTSTGIVYDDGTGLTMTQSSTLIIARTDTATTTIIQGAPSSPACSVFYTPSGTPIYSTYLATGQILTGTDPCN